MSIRDILRLIKARDCGAQEILDRRPEALAMCGYDLLHHQAEIFVNGKPEEFKELLERAPNGIYIKYIFHDTKNS